MYAAAQPAASALDILGCNAYPVLATVGSAEGEFALGGAALGNDAVVVVECLLHSDEDAYVRLGLVSLGGVVPGFGVVVS